ncbi:unnamed protein product [Tilletia controversa]|nr:unnamed protein product [Tilletia controversa]
MSSSPSWSPSTVKGAGAAIGRGGPGPGPGPGPTPTAGTTAVPNAPAGNLTPQPQSISSSQAQTTAFISSQAASTASASAAPSHYNHHHPHLHHHHHYTTTDPSASASASTFPFSSSSSSSSSSPAPAALAFFPQQTGAYRQQQQQRASSPPTAFTPQGNTSFASFLTPHQESESDSAFSAVLTRPRAGTLPSNVYADDFNPVADSSSTAYPSPLGYSNSSDDRYGAQQGISSLSPPLSHPSLLHSAAAAAAAAAPGTTRVPRRQTFYTGTGTGTPSREGSSSASLVSSSTFQSFYPLIGSLSASASRPSSSAGHASFGLDHSSNAPTTASRTRAASSLIPSSLSLSSVNIHSDGSGGYSSQQQGAPAGSTTHFFPGRVRGHTTGVAVGSSSSSPSISDSAGTSPNLNSGTQPSSSSSSSAAAAAAAAATAAAGLFIRHPSPLGPGLGIGSSSPSHITSTSASVRPSSPPSLTRGVIGRGIASTAPNSTLHSPTLGLNGNGGGPANLTISGASAAGGFFGRDGLFGANTPISGSAGIPSSPSTGAGAGATNGSNVVRSTSSSHGPPLGRTRARPSTSSAASPFLNTRVESGAGSPSTPSGWNSLSTAGTTLFGVDIGGSYLNKNNNNGNGTSSARSTMPPSTSSGADDFYMHQTEEAMVGRVGGGASAGLRTASSGAHQLSQQQQLSDPYEHHQHERANMRSRALTLAHPNPHSHPHPLLLHGGLGHAFGDGGASSSYGIAAQEDGGMGGLGYGSMLDAAQQQQQQQQQQVGSSYSINEQEDGARIGQQQQQGVGGAGPNRPRAISTGAPPPFFSREGRTPVFGPGGMGLGNGTPAGGAGGGGGAFLTDSLAFGGSPRLEGSESLLYNNNHNANNTNSGVVSQQQAPNPTSTSTLSSYDNVATPTLSENAAARILRDYALEHGLNPSRFVQAAADMGLGVNLPVHHHLQQHHAHHHGNVWGPSAGAAGGGAGVGGGNNVLMEMRGVGVRPSVSFQEPENGHNSGSSNAALSSLLSTLASNPAAAGSGSGAGGRPSLTHTQSTPVVPPTSLGRTQLSSNQDRLLGARDDLAASPTGTAPSAHDQLLSLVAGSSSLSSASPRARAATASFAGGAFGNGGGGGGGGGGGMGDSLTMALAAHMASAAAEERDRERGHALGGQQGQGQTYGLGSSAVLESGDPSAAQAGPGGELESSYGSSSGLAPLANRFRSGTMAAGAPSGFVGLGAGGVGRLRAEQELMRMAAIIKATQALQASGNGNGNGSGNGGAHAGSGVATSAGTGTQGSSAATTAVNRSTDSAGGRSVSSRGGSQRPQTADSGALHRAQQQQQQQQPELSAAAASEALAAALHATGEAGMSLLPPPAASRSGSSFVTRASRSNSNASAQSGLTPSPTTGPNTPGGGSGFFGGHHHSQARPRAATTAALSQGGWLGSGANNVNIGGGAFSGHVTPVSGEPSTGAGAGGGRQHLHSHGATATSNQQTPTRSLWIGNLDSSVTGQELTRAFAPYGAVESVRLLPEKECGFVNFIDLDDAVRAREDVLVRLGGRLALVETPLAPSGQPRTGGTGANGQVRIGYGKVDSAPGVAQPPLGTGGDGAAANGANFGDAVPDGFGAENTQPTRALWIGSIPNTTTQADLLNIFQPFGPVESVRVLTHKNCGFINFERVDDAMLARTALHSRDFLGAENGVIRIGFAKVPTRNTEEFTMVDEVDVAAGGMPAYPQATIDALSQLQGANGISGEQQLNSGYIENYRSNLIVNLLQNQVSQQAQSQSQSQSQPQPQQQPQQQQQPPQLQQQQPPSTPQEAFVPTAAMGTVPAPQGGSAVAPSNEKGGVTLPPHLQPHYSVSDLQLLMHELGENEPAGQARTDVLAAAEARPLATYYSSIPLVAEVCKNRRFDPNRLREIRRLMDSPNFSTAEVDNLAQEYMKDIVDLAADYIGNTAVQKFFERASENCKYMMLEELAPHLAMIGIHKNGTWSAQKIIESCRRPDQVELISKHLRPYVPPLMLDQFGNYVVQCVLPFCSPASDFVFDAMVDRIWEVAQGRFGARSMRACLENNNHVTRRQIKRVACAIILHAVPLSTNANGALLLTWLLDTSNLAARYRLLAPRFAPHLAQLCTHKLSHITIWRLVSQNKDMSASRLILDTLFGKAGAGERDDDNAASERARGSKEISPLEEIVVDQLHGSGFIAKVLASPVVEAMKTDGRPDKPRYVAQVRKLLVRNRLVGMPAYRRLLEEVGLAETLPAAVAPPPQALAPGPPPPLLHGLTSPPPFGMMAGGLPPGVGLPHPHSHLPPPPPPGAPALPEQGMSPPPIPPQLLAAAVAGNHAALQELVHMGFLPPGAVPLPGGAGTGMDPAQLNDMMGQMQLGQQMYGQGGPAPPPFGGAPPGHLGGVGGGGRGQPGMGGPPGHGHGHGHGHAHAHSHGHGHGHGHHNSQSVDFYSMSPEQAVGSGLLSPPPAPRSMGWPAQPAPPQSSFMGSFSPWDTADLPNPGGPFGRPAARTGRGGRPSTSPFAPGPAPRR